MRNKILIGLIFTILLSGCKKKVEKSNISSSEGEQETGSCLEKQDKEQIVKAILVVDDMNEYVKPTLENAKNIELLKNEFITKDMSIKIEDDSVQIVDSLNASEKVFKLDFQNIDCAEKKIPFTIWYEFEHADLTGYVFKKNIKWHVKITGHGIVD